MECDPTDSTSFPEPEHIGVRVEILPDLYVEVETARRIHALLFVLAALLVICAFGPNTALRQALTRRPLLASDTPLPPATHAAVPTRPASELRFLEGFARARKRALDVLQYAITTAPPALKTQRVLLAGDPAAPLDPSRFRLKMVCAPIDPTTTRNMIENLRALLPATAVAPSDADDEGTITIDSAASPAAPPVLAAAEALAGAPAEALPNTHIGATPEAAAAASAELASAAPTASAADLEPVTPASGRLAAIPPPQPIRAPSALHSASTEDILAAPPTNGLLAAARAMDPLLSRAPLLPDRVRGSGPTRTDADDEAASFRYTDTAAAASPAPALSPAPAASAPPATSPAADSRTRTFPRASAIPAPESGRLIPLFSAAPVTAAPSATTPRSAAPAPLASARALPPAPEGADEADGESDDGAPE